MKLSLIVIALASISAVFCRNINSKVKNVGATPTSFGSVGFIGGEWVANVQCTFFNEIDCDISIHANGRRIDGTTHNANEDVLVSCLDTRPSIDLVIHDFAFADLQDYTCLEDTTLEFSSQWLNVQPVIETSGTFNHGQQVSLICNAPLDSQVFWVLPGPSSDHQAATLTYATNAQNSSTTVTFTIQDSDHFAAYNCCIGLQSGQPRTNPCTTYTVVDEESLSEIVTTEDYSTVQFHITADVCLSPLADPNTVRWSECIAVGTCLPLTPAYYDVIADPDNHKLVSHLNVVDNTNYNLYTFSVSSEDDSVEAAANFTVRRLTYYPLFTKLPTQVYFNQADGTYTAVLQVAISADPAPSTITWTKQQINQASFGDETLTTGGRYAISTVALSSTECQTTLAISPYDVDQDDAIFTVIAVNDNGQNCFDGDSTVGPSYLNFVRTSVGNIYSYQCIFESFPYADYEINIVASYSTSYVVSSSTTDPLYSQTTLNIDVTVDPQNTDFQISCTVYNPYDPTIYQTQSVVTVVA